jgi:hypothetical protein
MQSEVVCNTLFVTGTSKNNQTTYRRKRGEDQSSTNNDHRKLDDESWVDLGWVISREGLGWGRTVPMVGSVSPTPAGVAAEIGALQPLRSGATGLH